MPDPARLCTCGPRESVPYMGTDTCYRCGGELVSFVGRSAEGGGRPLLRPLPSPVERPAEDTAESQRTAIAVITAVLGDDLDAAERMLQTADDPRTVALFVAGYAAGFLSASDDVEPFGVMEALALAVAQ
jgi:hypothetical protein